MHNGKNGYIAGGQRQIYELGFSIRIEQSSDIQTPPILGEIDSIKPGKPPIVLTWNQLGTRSAFKYFCSHQSSRLSWNKTKYTLFRFQVLRSISIPYINFFFFLFRYWILSLTTYVSYTAKYRRTNILFLFQWE